jgi:hypothetical protein
VVRHVRGVLFLDYVRMLRACKSVDMRAHLHEEDLPYLAQRIDGAAWYPMATFERLGNAILHLVAKGDMLPVRLWGRYSATPLRNAHPALLVAGNPIETIERFHLLRATFFDFDALQIDDLHEEGAHLVIRYHMGMPAEEAAANQTIGFFEGLLELAGAQHAEAELRERSWAGGARTLAVMRWRRPKG